MSGRNNLFWNTPCHLFFDKKLCKSSKITLEESEILTDDTKIAEHLILFSTI